MKKVTIILLLLIISLYSHDDYYYNNGEKIILIKMQNNLRANISIDYYQNENGITLGVSDRVILQLKESDSLKKYLLEFNLTLETTLGTNMYLLKVKNRELTLDVANRLSEKDDVVYAQPDFVKKHISR